MHSYDNYQETSEKWLPSIPNNWRTVKFKYLFEIRKRIAGQLGFEVLSITQKGIKVKDVSSGEGQIASDYSKYQIVEVGDYAMNHMDLLTGFVDRSIFDGVTSPDYRVFSLVNSTCLPEYCLYLLQIGYTDKIFYPLGQGAAHVGRWRLPTEAFKNFKVPVPSIGEQEAICKFLKNGIGRIDRLVLEKKLFIKLLQEKRQALISHVVTKGLDETVKMKNSGVDWIGEMPENWDYCKLGHLFRLYNGSTPKSGEQNYWDGDIEWVTPSDLSKLKSLEIGTGKRKITAAGLNSCGATIVPSNSIILSTRAPIGSVALTTNPMCTNQGCKSLVARNNTSVSEKFYAYLLSVVSNELNIRGKGTTFLELSTNELSSFPVPKLHIRQQLEIVEHIEKTTKRINDIIYEVNNSTVLLKERRAALISAAVTGKIDVREAV